MLAVAFSVAVGLISIDAADDCPSAEAVAAALKSLAPPTSETPVTIELRSTDAGMMIRFRDANGASAKRWLDAQPSCAARAEAAAVVIAAYRLRLNDGTALRPPEMEPPEASSAEASASIRRSPPRRKPVAFEVSAAFVSAVASDGAFAPGAAAGLALARPNGRFAAHLALTGTGERSIALGDGHARWTRLAIQIGALYRQRLGSWVLDATADAVAALLLVEGDGFVDNRAATNFDPGLAAGLRIGRRWRGVTPFVGATATGWLRGQRVAANAVSSTVELPRFDALLTAGASFGNF